MKEGTYIYAKAILPLPRLYVAPRVQFDLSVPPPRVALKN